MPTPATNSVATTQSVAGTSVQGPHFSPEISLGDVSQALALPLALFVAWLTTRATLNQGKKSQLTTEVLHLLQDLQNRSERVASLLEMHLLGSCQGMTAKESRVVITVERKRCDSKLNGLCLLLPREAGSIRRAYQEWYRTLFDVGFLNNRNSALRPSDVRVLGIQRAHEQWDAYLDNLKIECLDHKLEVTPSKNDRRERREPSSRLAPRTI